MVGRFLQLYYLSQTIKTQQLWNINPSRIGFIVIFHFWIVTLFPLWIYIDFKYMVQYVLTNMHLHPISI